MSLDQLRPVAANGARRRVADVLNGPRLPPAQRLLLLVLALHKFDSSPHVKVSLDWLAAWTGAPSREQVTHGLEALSDQDLLSMTRSKGKLGQYDFGPGLPRHTPGLNVQGELPMAQKVSLLPYRSAQLSYAKRLVLFIGAIASDDGSTFALSYDALTRYSGLNRGTVVQAVKELQEGVPGSHWPLLAKPTPGTGGRPSHRRLLPAPEQWSRCAPDASPRRWTDSAPNQWSGFAPNQWSDSAPIQWMGQWMGLWMDSAPEHRSDSPSNIHSSLSLSAPNDLADDGSPDSAAALRHVRNWLRSNRVMSAFTPDAALQLAQQLDSEHLEDAVKEVTHDLESSMRAARDDERLRAVREAFSALAGGA